MLKYIFQIFFILITFTSSINSEEYNNILINGNQRVSDETILLFSELPNNKSLNENSINIVLKNLYKSGFFKDVVVKIENKNLIIDVIENPIIQTIFIEGIKRKKTEEALYDILSSKNRSSFNSYNIKSDEDKIMNYLKDKGFYFTKIISSYQDLGDNKIDLYYKIDLGKKAKISKISFVGDKKFKDSTLKNVIISDEYKFWKFISGKKYLNENLVNFDKRLLNNFYKNKGFYNVNIDSTFANFLGNSKFELIYNIKSGEKHYFNNLSIKLPDDYNENDFKKLEKLFSNLKGESYSLNSIDKILNEIDRIVLNEQYEFLKSTVIEEISENLVNLSFNIEESEKFYIEKINIFGNNVTREEVIRNVLAADEGDPFNELLHKKTLNNIKALNFFSDVNDQIYNGSSNSQKIININVDEKPTGEISAGAGVSTGGGSIAFGIKENNFLGRGIDFGSDLSVSSETFKGKVYLNNPNYNGSNKSLNLSLESTVTDYLKAYGYESNKTGFSVASGFEYYDDLSLNLGVSSYVEKLTTDSTASANMKKQEGSYFDTFFNYTLDYDKRNQRYQTTDGFRSRFTQNIPLISENYSLTSAYDLKFYNEWLNENIASYGVYASATNSLTGKNVKLSDRLFLPAKKLRGFEMGKIGPKDNKDYIGGNYALAFNASTTVPQILPNVQNANFSLFFDMASIWGVDYSSSMANNNEIRSSIGLAVDLFTPIGPLNFSFSEAITKGKDDITESFRFNLGTTF
ncbi:outer membrane protein assembly factor BamA [Candidatus Pelagibacter sp. Uisw_136]|uniref:outer membrane protein assembly factor BamA n=1 Tax=Candidatus Pelagibacter sp. Uisw_136 TaxID=3230991 RepID=UPI0039E8920F